MKKVKKDYELINTKKANKKYSILLIILTSLILLLSLLLIPLSQNNVTLLNGITIIIFLLCILLLHVTVSFNKLAYQHYKGIMGSPLWVPKVFGYGLSINPYNKIGRILTIVLLILLDLLFYWLDYRHFAFWLSCDIIYSLIQVLGHLRARDSIENVRIFVRKYFSLKYAK